MTSIFQEREPGRVLTRRQAIAGSVVWLMIGAVEWFRRTESWLGWSWHVGILAFAVLMVALGIRAFFQRSDGPSS